MPSTPVAGAARGQVCLVTGAAGFIGARVTAMLLAQGHTVVGVDNLNDYYDVRLKDWRLSQLLGLAHAPGGDPQCSRFASGAAPHANPAGTFTFRHLDIENLPALEALFAGRKFDVVYNLAARAGVRYSIENPHVYLSTNTLGTLNLLECMRRHGVKRHVLASTSSLYAGCPMPFTEDQPVNTPLSPYAATKKAAELLSSSYRQLHGITTVVLRYFTVYGPAGRPDMAPLRFIKWIDEGRPIQLHGDGRQSRDFTYVDDVARGTILAGQLTGEAPAAGTGCEIINLGGGREPVNLLRIIDLIAGLLGKSARIEHLPPHAADLPDTAADITKARRLLGWQPEVGVEEGFARAVEWYAANRAWLQDLRL